MNTQELAANLKLVFNPEIQVNNLTPAKSLILQAKAAELMDGIDSLNFTEEVSSLLTDEERKALLACAITGFVFAIRQ